MQRLKDYRRDKACLVSTVTKRRSPGHDSFQNHVTVNGELLQFVYVADASELVIDIRKQKETI